MVFRWLGLAALCVAGAVAVTWPLATQLDTGIPQGTEAVATVPLFNLWTLAWNVESAHRGFAGYWQAPIFHPAPDTFALSEPQPLTGLVATLLCGLGFSILTAYNLILVGGLALNGLLGIALARRVGLAWLPSLAAGALLLVLPFTHQELGVLQLVPLAGALLFALVGLRFLDAPGPRTGWPLGLALAVAYGLSAQIAVFCALVAIPVVLWLGWSHRRQRDAWVGLLVGAGLFLVLVFPLLLAQGPASEGESFSRSLDTVRKQSAQLSHYRSSPWPSWVPTPGITTAKKPSARAFWPGTLKVLLALVALATAWRHPRWRLWAVAGAVALAAAFLLSLGANLGVGETSVASLVRLVPGLSQVRSFFRFALFVQLAVVFLAALGLHRLHTLAQSRMPARGATALVALLALLTVAEAPPTMGAIQTLPPLDLELPWVDWIEDHTEPNDVLAFVPFPQGRSSRDYLGTSQWMYWQLRHWRPMVNGYSGFFPKRFRQLKKSMESFPSQETLRALEDSGVRYCIVHRNVIESSPAPDPKGPLQLVSRFQDTEHGLAIFELRRDGS